MLALGRLLLICSGSLLVTAVSWLLEYWQTYVALLVMQALCVGHELPSLHWWPSHR